MAKKKKVLNVILILSAVLLLLVAVLKCRRSAEVKLAVAVQESVTELYRPEVTAAQPSAEPPAPEPERRMAEDFLPLYKENEHTVGWLKAGEQIDYPVVQKDNDYYLYHDFYGKEDSNGTLFINEYNLLKPRDDVLLIHGHNMASGAMFGTLDYYEDYSYVCENPVLSFRTAWDDEEVYYTPVSVFNASMIPGDPSFFDVMRLEFIDDEESTGDARVSVDFQRYLDEISSRRIWQPETDVTVNDSLLMLITCSYYQNDGRLMVICRRLRDDETPESIAALYAWNG